MNNNLKIAIIQPDLAWENIEKNLNLFSEKIDLIEEAVDLIVLPEMFSTGFSMNAGNLAEPPHGTAFKWMQEIARKRNVAVVGSVIVKENNNFYNRLYFVFPDTTFKTYDKRH